MIVAFDLSAISLTSSIFWQKDVNNYVKEMQAFASKGFPVVGVRKLTSYIRGIV